MSNKEKFKRDFLFGELYKKIKELQKEKYEKIKELRKKNPGEDIFNLCKTAEEEYEDFISKYPNKIRYMDPKHFKTIYSSAVAHYKGKLHMKKVSWEVLQNIVHPILLWEEQQPKYQLYSFRQYIKNNNHMIDKERLIFDWTMEDQARLAEIYLKPYRNEKSQIELLKNRGDNE